MLFEKSRREVIRWALTLLVAGALSNLLAGLAAADLIAHWTLDDGLTDDAAMIALDSSGKGNDGELTNFIADPFWEDGKYGGALNFSGETGAIVADIGDDLSIDNEPRTIAAWINLDFPMQAFFASYGTGGAGNQFALGVEDNGGIPNIRLRHGGGNMFFEGEVLELEWNHIAAVVPDGAEFTGDVLMYLNGEEVVAENPTQVALSTDMSGFVIGGKWDIAENRAFEGLIDDVWLFDEALDQAEIVKIMNGEGFEPPRQTGDCNEDGGLDAADLACISTVDERDAVLDALNTLPGDLNGDGAVAFEDFLTMSANFGTASSGYPEGNVDMVNGVDFADFLALSANFGQAAAAASVPEPHGCHLLLATLTALVASRRRDL